MIKEAALGERRRRSYALHIEGGTSHALYIECSNIMHVRYRGLASSQSTHVINKEEWGKGIQALVPTSVLIGEGKLKIVISGGFDETIAIEYVLSAINPAVQMDELWLRSSNGDRLLWPE